MTYTSGRMTEVLAAMKPFMRFFETSTWARRRFEPGISDFADPFGAGRVL
ncbi:MAG: hypothetical protein JSV66_02035 [Trueperaceae bacterium]|nr:MAG: hypothetical protein JSV66_02035 [Trueperaceae bacterium]